MSTLRDHVLEMLQDLRIKPTLNRGQHFLISTTILAAIVKAASLSKNDIVVEIGPGVGFLTRALSRKTRRVIAIEIDRRFRPVLAHMPRNVEIVFDNARDVLRRKEFEFNKIVANLPYNMCEPLLHYLNFAKHVERATLMIAKDSALSAQKNPVFSAFLTIKIVKEIRKDAFLPRPRTTSAIVNIMHRPDYEEDHDTSAFIRRKLYMRESMKLKNGLQKTLMDVYKLKYGERLTKRQAKTMLGNLHFHEKLLDTKIEHIPHQAYWAVAGKLSVISR